MFTANIYGTNVRQLMPYGLAEPHGFAAARWSPDGAEIISEKPTGGGSLFASTALGLPHPSETGTTQHDDHQSDSRTRHCPRRTALPARFSSALEPRRAWCHVPRFALGMRAATVTFPGVRDCAATARRAVLIGWGDIDTDVARPDPSSSRVPAADISVLQTDELPAQAESIGA